MVDIDKAIVREMGSALKRNYVFIVFLYLFVDYIHAPQIMLIMFIAPPADAFNYTPYAKNAQTIVSEWKISPKDIDWISGFLQSIFFFGFMIGTVLFGQLSDKFGRRNVSWKVYTLLMIGSFSTAFTQNWQQMSVCRFLSGASIGGLAVINTIMLQEMCAARLWVYNGVLGQLSFTFCMIWFLLFGYFFPSWRNLSVISTLPALLGYFFYIFVPESPRWLISQGRVHEAKRVIQLFAKRNGSANPDYEFLNFDDNINSPQLSSTVHKNSILDLIKHPALRYRSIILSVIWFTTSFVYYCITLGAGSFSPNFYLAFGMSAVSQLPSVPICLFFMERKWCGRRGTLSGLMFLTSLSMFAMYILPNTEGNAHYRLILSMVAKVGASGCFTLIYVYTPELYPTVVRNVGLGSMSTIARFGSMSAPFLAAYTVNSGSQIPFLVYGLLCGISGVIALILPETRGKRIVNTIDEAYEHEDETS